MTETPPGRPDVAAIDDELWTQLERRLTRHFEDPETSTTRVVLWTGDERDRGTQVLRFRTDRVGEWEESILHVVALAKNERVFQLLRNFLPLRLTEPASPMLVVEDASDKAPVVMAGQFSIVADAAAGIVGVLAALGASFSHVAVYTAVVAQPAVVALRQARRYRATPSGNCAECGRPLSDPESLRIGFGPECFARLHPRVRRLVEQPTLPAVVHPASSSLSRWAAQVEGEWTIGQRTSPM